MSNFTTDSLFADDAAGAKQKRESFNWYERIARRKLSLSDDWEACRWECIGHPHTKDVLVEMGIPRLLKTGKYKGQRTWKDTKDFRKCVVTESELADAEAGYEREGKCFACYGSGEEWAGWSAAEGTKYRPCKRCGATGKPRAADAAA
jgi:hypothetical protein